MNDINSILDSARSLVTFTTILTHDDWNPHNKRYDADILLLKFKEGDIDINSAYSKPICLWDSEPYPDTSEGVVLGWSEQVDYTKRNVPIFTKMEILTLEYCFSGNHLAAATVFSSRAFCAGVKNGLMGTCYGTTGGGLFIIIDGVYYLKGIDSTKLSIGSGHCDISTFSAYTDIYKFINWIKDVTDGAIETRRDIQNRNFQQKY